MHNMNVIVAGDSNVGYVIAEALYKEGCNVVLIDKNEDTIAKANAELDVICIKGKGHSAGVLLEAGIRDADILIAASPSDEMNMVCCLTAKKLGASYTVARIRDPEYAHELDMLKNELGIDLIINPEREIALEISRVVRFPSAVDIESFVGGRVEMVEFRVFENDPMVGVPLHKLAKTHSDILFCAVERESEIIIPNGEYMMQVGDMVFIVGEPFCVMQFFKKTGKYMQKIKNSIIIGGGKVAYYLSQVMVEMGIKVKIIEANKDRCMELNELLPKVMVINGDGTEQDLLDSENIEETGAFIALSNNDEDNAMASLYAMRCGVKTIITMLNRVSYIDILKSFGIYSSVCPMFTTANMITRYVRSVKNSKGSFVENLYKMLDGNVEVLEFTATSTTHFLDIAIMELNLRKNLLIAAIARGRKIIVPRGTDKIHEGDKIVVVAPGGKIVDLNDIFAH